MKSQILLASSVLGFLLFSFDSTATVQVGSTERADQVWIVEYYDDGRIRDRIYWCEEMCDVVVWGSGPTDYYVTSFVVGGATRILRSRFRGEDKDDGTSDENY